MIYSAAILAKRYGILHCKAALTEASSEAEALGKVLNLCHQEYPISEYWVDHQATVGLSVEAFLRMFPNVRLES